MTPQLEPSREPVLERFAGEALVSSRRGAIGPWTDVQQLTDEEVNEYREDEERIIYVRSGELWYRDELGSDVVVPAGDAATIRCGDGLRFSYGGSDALVLFRGGARYTQAFYHHEWVAVMDEDRIASTIIAGEFRGYQGLRRDRSDGVAVWVQVEEGASGELFIRPTGEHAVIVLAGSVYVEGEELQVGEGLYLGMDRFSVSISAQANAELLLLGGRPL